MNYHRFYLPQFKEPALSAEESHHALKVLRLRAGNIILCFDGYGKEAKSVIESIQKNRVYLRLLEISETPKPSTSLTLIQAVTKVKSMEWIIQKATELGVERICPLLTEHSTVELSHEKAGSRQIKWQQIAIEACKQCGQNWIPHVDLPMPLSDFLKSSYAELKTKSLKLIADLHASASLSDLLAPLRDSKNPSHPSQSIAYAIGPEGDFTPNEIEQFKAAGFLPASLGPIVLRSETAAIYLTSVLTYELEAWAKIL